MPYSSQISHPAPGGMFFFFADVTSAVQNHFPHVQARAVSVPVPACAFCPDTYSADGCAAQMFQTYGTNFRSHPAQRPLGRACATVHAAAANAVRIPSCAALRSSSSAFAQSLGTPFPRMYSFPNWYFAQGVTNLRTYTSDACAASAKSRAADPASTARPFPFRKYFASLYLANPFPCSAARSNQSAAAASSKNGDVSSACSFPSAYSAK